MKRIVKLFTLNTGTLQARGLFNVTPKDDSDKRCSYWFEKDTATKLKAMNAEDFNKWCNSQVS